MSTGKLSRQEFELLKKQEAEGVISPEGLEALEPYRVKKAVILAAGFGSRMVPITLNTPKPLVRVHGKRIIDGLLDAIVAAGIEEVILVRGYLGEQFDQLLYKYPMITFIENPLYNEANNISSAMSVRDLLENAYVCEADLLVHNPKLVEKYQYCSNFLGIKVDESDDWCFTVEDGIIREQIVGGKEVDYPGKKLYQEVGISYWDKEAGEHLAEDIKAVYEMPDGPQRYWDQVPFKYWGEHYQVELRECSFEDIIEIDSFRELQQIDKAYEIG